MGCGKVRSHGFFGRRRIDERRILVGRVGLLGGLAVDGLLVDGLLVDGLAVLIHGLTVGGLSMVLLHNDDPCVVVIIVAVVPVMGGVLESKHASSASGRSHDGADAAEDEQEGQSPPEPHELVACATAEALVAPAALRGAVDVELTKRAVAQISRSVGVPNSAAGEPSREEFFFHFELFNYN